MELKQGDIVRYSYPYLLKRTKNNIVGKVEIIGEDFVFIRNRDVEIKIPSIFYNGITKIGSIEETSFNQLKLVTNL